MSMVPLRFRDWWDDWELERPFRLMDQHFGTGINRDELLSSVTSTFPTLLRNRYYRPWRSALARQESSSTINLSKEKFEVILDVQQFTPEEITVKTSDNCIVVEGKHDEKQDEHGYISRQFIRRYVLPQGYDTADVVSSLSSDGVLTISAPQRAPINTGERVVPINKTGPSRTTEIKTELPKNPQPTTNATPKTTEIKTELPPNLQPTSIPHPTMTSPEPIVTSP